MPARRYTFALTDSGGSPGYINVNVTGSTSNLVWSGGNGATWDFNSSLQLGHEYPDVLYLRRRHLRRLQPQ